MTSDEIVFNLKTLLQPVEQILDYEFNNKNLLFSAFCHRSFKETYNINEDCYEKLEVLGDSILDYIANSNLIKFTIL